jgi:hypothetical protein
MDPLVLVVSAVVVLMGLSVKEAVYGPDVTRSLPEYTRYLQEAEVPPEVFVSVERSLSELRYLVVNDDVRYVVHVKAVFPNRTLSYHETAAVWHHGRRNAIPSSPSHAAKDAGERANEISQYLEAHNVNVTLTD